MSNTIIERMQAEIVTRAERVASLRQQLASAETAHSRLEDALKVAMEFDDNPNPSTDQAPAGKGIQESIRKLLLGASPDGMRHAEILNRLQEEDFRIESKQLSNALFHLATKGQVEKIERGHWRHKPVQPANKLAILLAQATAAAE